MRPHTGTPSSSGSTSRSSCSRQGPARVRVARPQAAAHLQLPQERRAQLEADVALVVLGRALEVPALHLDLRAVHEQRDVAQLRHPALDHRGRDPARHPAAHRAQLLHVRRPEAGQVLARAARVRVAPLHAQQRAGGPVPAQSVQVRQRPVAARQRGDQRPCALGVGNAPLAPSQRGQPLEIPEQIHMPRHAAQKRETALPREVAVAEIDLDLRNFCYHRNMPPARTWQVSV